MAEMNEEELKAFEETEMEGARFQKKEIGDLISFFDGSTPVEEEKKEEVKEEKKEEKKEEEKREEIKKEKVNLPNLFEKLYQKKDFLTKEQLDTIIDKPEQINTAIYESRAELMDYLADALPVMMELIVQREIVTNNAVSAFYESNEDLKEHSHYVQTVFKEIEQGNKEKPYPEIFALTANLCRKRLGLKEPLSPSGKNVQTNTGEGKPAFAGSKTGTSSPINKTGKKEMFDPAAEELMNLND